MVPRNSFVRALLCHVFYSSDAACNAPLLALFDKDLRGGEMASNCWNFFLHTSLGGTTRRLLSLVKLKAFFAQCIIAPCMGLLQHVFFGYYVQRYENVLMPDLGTLGEDLFHWTMEEVEQYLEASRNGCIVEPRQ